MRLWEEAAVALETPLTDLVTVRSRFVRSVSLARDWRRDDALLGYVLTPGGRDILGRLAAARTHLGRSRWTCLAWLDGRCGSPSSLRNDRGT